MLFLAMHLHSSGRLVLSDYMHHPPVTEIEEFVGVSCPDIYSSRFNASADPSNKLSAPALAIAENGGPSRTEMITITDPDVYERLTAEGFIPGGAGGHEGQKEEFEMDEVDAEGVDETRMFLDKTSRGSNNVIAVKEARRESAKGEDQGEEKQEKWKDVKTEETDELVT